MEGAFGVVRFWAKRPVVPGLVWPTSVDRAVDTVRALDARLCVSIADPDRRAAADRHLEGVGCPVLRLDVDDIERPAPGCIMPTPAHLATVLAAVRALRAADPVVVHCQAGISRSAAVALSVAADRWIRTGHTSEAGLAAAFDQVVRVAPHIRPNVALMEMAAPLLGVDSADWMCRAWALHR